MKEGDELIISLDPSSDNTEEIIRAFAKRDRRIKWLRGEGKGLVNNFGNAIRHCSNDIIFLSDQDDLWKKGKVDIVLSYFEDPKINVVMHDAEIVNEKGERRDVYKRQVQAQACEIGETAVKSAAEGSMTKTLEIEGMMCGHCEKMVKRCLEKFPQISEAVVSHEAGTAVISMSEDVPEDEIKQAIENAGYEYLGTKSLD